MIGEIVQHVLDKGFFIRFTYDGEIGYHFRAWKFYKDDICTSEWTIDHFIFNQVNIKDILIMEADRYLKLVDDSIAQRRLIDSALK